MGKCLHCWLINVMLCVFSSQDDLRHIRGELSTVQTLLASLHESRLSVARELTTKWKKSREQCAALEVRECELQLSILSLFHCFIYFHCVC